MRDDQITELIDLMRRTMRGVKQRMYQELREYDLTVPQMWVLRTLHLEGIHSLAELSRKVGMSTSTASGIIDRLVRMGLVDRRRDEADRRVVWLQLSEKGRSLVERVPALHFDYFRSLLEKMPEEDAEGLIRHLRTLLSIIEEETRQ
ncbi:MAG: MarR family transcriptional regulator [Alicyclobacillaceae bacterium]|nr:MarR family transcriptional regulator [Alicyclobacillaceae bacterium]